MWAKLKRFFANRWVLSAIGLLVLSLLIWFAGDAIAVYDMRPLGPAWARLGLIIGILVFWGAWEGFKVWRAVAPSARPRRSPRSGSAGPRSGPGATRCSVAAVPPGRR